MLTAAAPELQLQAQHGRAPADFRLARVGDLRLEHLARAYGLRGPADSDVHGGERGDWPGSFLRDRRKKAASREQSRRPVDRSLAAASKGQRRSPFFARAASEGAPVSPSSPRSGLPVIHVDFSEWKDVVANPLNGMLLTLSSRRHLLV